MQLQPLCALLLALLPSTALGAAAPAADPDPAPAPAPAPAPVASLGPRTPQAAMQELPEVRHLSGEPDFRDVTLRWEYPRLALDLQEFHVRYCELQAWGPHRCRTKVVPWASGRDALLAEGAGPGAGAAAVRAFAVDVGGLRMATNYSFAVQPVEGRRARAPALALPHAHALAHALAAPLQPRRIVVPTKGFSARATQCLPHASEVEVQTGPYFGGRIAVEASRGAEGGGGGGGGAGGERCAVAGDPQSARAAYVLRIDHDACGVHVNATTVATYVLVQENLPILTHSTRRFLVLCTYQPETLTVRAGINLPTHGSSYDSEDDNRIEQSLAEAIPFDTSQLDTLNDVQVARLQQHKHIVDALEESIVQDQTVAQLALMVIVVVAMVLGSAVAAWWLFINPKRKSSGSITSTSTEPCAPLYENFENSLRDASSKEDRTTRKNPGETSTDSDDNSILDIGNCPSGVFTIRTPATRPNTSDAQACITIAPTSHSEA